MNRKENQRQRAHVSPDYHSGTGTVFCFNTLPLIKGFIYSFTNFKGYGSYDLSDFETTKICLRMPVWEDRICLRLNMQLFVP